MAAKEKTKMVTVKFLANTSHAGKVRQKNSILEVTEDDALTLIDGKHATEAKPEKPE